MGKKNKNKKVLIDNLSNDSYDKQYFQTLSLDGISTLKIELYKYSKQNLTLKNIGDYMKIVNAMIKYNLDSPDMKDYEYSDYISTLKFESSTILDDSFPTVIKVPCVKVDDYDEDSSFSQQSDLDMLDGYSFNKSIYDLQNMPRDINILQNLDFKVKSPKKETYNHYLKNEECILNLIENMPNNKLSRQTEKEANLKDKIKKKIKNLKNDLKKKYFKDEKILEYDLDFDFQSLIYKARDYYDKEVQKTVDKIDKEYSKYINNRKSEIIVTNKGIEKIIGKFGANFLEFDYAKKTSYTDAYAETSSMKLKETFFESIGRHDAAGKLEGIGLSTRTTYSDDSKPIIQWLNVGNFLEAEMLEGVCHDLRIHHYQEEDYYLHQARICIYGGTFLGFVNELFISGDSGYNFEEKCFQCEIRSIIDTIFMLNEETFKSSLEVPNIPDDFYTKKTSFNENEYLIQEYEEKSKNGVSNLTIENFVKSKQPTRISYVIYKPDKAYEYVRYNTKHRNEKIYYWNSKEKLIEHELRVDCSGLSYFYTKSFNFLKPMRLMHNYIKKVVKEAQDIEQSGKEIDKFADSKIVSRENEYIEFTFVSLKPDIDEIYLALRQNTFQVENKKIEGKLIPYKDLFKGKVEYNFQNDLKETYEGDLFGFRYGNFGKRVFSNKSTYEGQAWNCEFQLEGKFQEWYGAYYDGYWVNGQKDGYGEFFTHVDPKLKKNILESKSEGIKQLFDEFPDYQKIIDSKEMYRGQFQFGQKFGFGIQISHNGEIYLGCFKNNNKDGPGAQFKVNETILIGYWQDNKIITLHKVIFGYNIHSAKKSLDKLNMVLNCILKVKHILFFINPDFKFYPDIEFKDDKSIEEQHSRISKEQEGNDIELLNIELKDNHLDSFIKAITNVYSTDFIKKIDSQTGMDNKNIDSREEDLSDRDFDNLEIVPRNFGNFCHDWNLNNVICDRLQGVYDNKPHDNSEDSIPKENNDKLKKAQKDRDLYLTKLNQNNLNSSINDILKTDKNHEGYHHVNYMGLLNCYEIPSDYIFFEKLYHVLNKELGEKFD